MEYFDTYPEYGYPFTGAKLEELKTFLSAQGLDYDDGIGCSIVLKDQNTRRIIASGSLHDNVLKCLAVDDSRRGDGLLSTILSWLMTEAFRRRYSHLFLFTKPENQLQFSSLGFYPITETKDVLFMENTRNGLFRYIDSLPKAPAGSVVGSAVVNCNPFTLGHRYLVTQASKQCDVLYLFVLSEDKSAFPADVRFQLVKEGIEGLNNVILLPSSDYMISSATFPTYFIKEKGRIDEINYTLDLTIFAEHFGPGLHIAKRFVGTEPFCAVTGGYNSYMKSILPPRGIEVIELDRMEMDGIPVSASAVRALFKEGRMEEVKQLVPDTTYQFLRSEKGQEIRTRLQSAVD